MSNNIIKSENVILESSEKLIKFAESKEEPQIIINKKDNIIESIDVICSCGRKIHIICKYEE